MKFYFSILFLIAFCSACANYEAGNPVALAASGESTGTRGGGKGILCNSVSGQGTLESLDRYEAIHALNYPVPESQSYEIEKNRILEKFLDGFGDSPLQYHPENREKDKQLMLDELDRFNSRLQFLPLGQHLPSVDDAGKVVPFPVGCSLVQIITFIDEPGDDLAGKILVDREYWSRLAPQDQFVFFLHELIYRALRNYGELTSERVRKIAGRLVSSTPYPSQYEALKNVSEAIRCLRAGEDLTTYGLDFYVIPDGDPTRGKSLLVFSTLLSKAALASLTAHSSIPYEVWKGGAVNNMERLTLESFLGNRSAYLRLQGPATGDPNFRGGDPARWTIQLKENGRLLEPTRFHCHVQMKE